MPSSPHASGIFLAAGAATLWIIAADVVHADDVYCGFCFALFSIAMLLLCSGNIFSVI